MIGEKGRTLLEIWSLRTCSWATMGVLFPLVLRSGAVKLSGAAMVGSIEGSTDVRPHSGALTQCGALMVIGAMVVIGARALISARTVILIGTVVLSPWMPPRMGAGTLPMLQASPRSEPASARSGPAMSGSVPQAHSPGEVEALGGLTNSLLPHMPLELLEVPGSSLLHGSPL